MNNAYLVIYWYLDSTGGCVDDIQVCTTEKRAYQIAIGKVDSTKKEHEIDPESEIYFDDGMTWRAKSKNGVTYYVELMKRPIL